MPGPGTIAITAGAGTPVGAYLGTGADDQYVRERPANTSVSPASWTLATSALPNKWAADTTRRSLTLYNASTVGWVYIGYGANTAPTTAAGGFDDVVPPGGYLEVAAAKVELAGSLIASAVGGALNISQTTSVV